MEIRLISTPCFIATKLDAFQNRGKDDFTMSSDMEDIINVIDGRVELADEIKASSPELRHFLSTQFKKFLKNEYFLEGV